MQSIDKPYLPGRGQGHVRKARKSLSNHAFTYFEWRMFVALAWVSTNCQMGD